jgi:NADH:ubiquinone oxidoreductase subunit K
MSITLFFISLVLFTIGAYVALFTVTRRNELNVLVCLAFVFGAFVNLGLILVQVLQSS